MVDYKTDTQDQYLKVAGLSIAGVDLPSTAVDELATLGGLTATAAELNTLDGILATVTELNQTCDVSTRHVAAGATLTVTAALHADKVILLDTLAGSVCTLPAATGTGNVYRFMTSVIATSNSHIVQVANATDVMTGSLNVVDHADGTVTAFGTVAASDTITLNRTTTGSVKIGEYIEIRDVKAGFFSVFGTVTATGAEANPFSAAVS
jgi:hypothetical protein